MLQRDLALALSGEMRLEVGLELTLGAALEASGMDCGGVYFLDETSGALELTRHVGVSDEFARCVACVAAGSELLGRFRASQPFYTADEETHFTPARKEGLRATAVLPLAHEGQTIGSLVVASRSRATIEAPAREALETIAATRTSTRSSRRPIGAPR